MLPEQMAMIVKELVARDTEVKKALANAPEAVQEVAQTRPNPFHGVTMYTNAIGIMASIFTRSVVDGAMLVSGLGGKVVDVVLIGEELGAGFDFGRDDGLGPIV